MLLLGTSFRLIRIRGAGEREPEGTKVGVKILLHCVTENLTREH